MPCGYLKEFNVAIVIDKVYLDSLLTNPEEVLVIDAVEYLPFYDKVKDKLKLLHGLYITGIGKPVVEFNTNHYILKGDDYHLITSADDIKTTKSDIYSYVQGRYKTYRKYSDLKKIVNNLTLTPVVNYAYVKFLEHMTYFIIQRFLEYPTVNDSRNFRSCFKPEHQNYVISDEFIDDFSDLYKVISDLVYQNRWNMYFVKSINTSIIVEKSVDYRIYDWCLARVTEH